MERVIFHCDLNCFFASVELLAHPELKKLPVAVCGNPERRHGIILAKNEYAKRFGVQTAETVFQAKKKCPSLVLLPPHYQQYTHYSAMVNDIYRRYTDTVEPFGIDESWLDMTGTLHLFGGDARRTADEIRRTVREETGLTLSVGVSFNKIFAKLGSDYKKPDATTVIPADGWKDIVFPLPARDLLFVGKSTADVLEHYGIRTVGDLASAQKETLVNLFGKAGAQLHDYASGLDSSPVKSDAEREPVHSVGNGTTFPKDLTRWEEVRTGLSLLCDSVALRLRRAGLYCGGVQVTIRYTDLKTVSRQMRRSEGTRLMKDIYADALSVTKELWDAPRPIRALTVTAIYVTEQAEVYRQIDLFASPTESLRQEKREALETAMDGIRRRYGKDVIAYGTPTEKYGVGHSEET